MYKSYGTISRQEKNWHIECEPHVKTRLKRVFPQVSQHASKFIELSDTPSNCHDLLWFIERYPMRVDDLKYMKAQSKAYVSLKEDILDVMDYKRPIKTFDLAVPPYEYQRAAADLLLNVKGLLLGDDLGLGKTASGICPMILPESLPALFVTMTHLPMQIKNEIERFAPHLKCHILKKASPYPLHKEGEAAPDVIITSYSKLNGWAEYLAGKIKYVVFDEIQELRTGYTSQKYSAAKLISDQAELRLGLSATPIYNYGDEFYNIIEILRPDSLGTATEFAREWCSQEKRINDPKAFGMFLRDEGLMLRRTRADVNRELPPVQIIPQYVESDPKVLDQIKGKAMELAKVILSSTQEFQGQKLRATEEFNIMMRQATGIAKAPYVAEFVRMLVESGESVMLYGWHRDVYNIWLERLAEFNPVMYTGTEGPSAKERSKQAFLNDESKVFISSLRSSAGLDGLQYHSKCKTFVFGELDWSPGVHDQCIGRLDRDGQIKQISAYYLLADSGSDPIISDVLGIKKGQLEGVKNPNGELFEHLITDGGGIKRLAEHILNKKVA